MKFIMVIVWSYPNNCQILAEAKNEQKKP